MKPWPTSGKPTWQPISIYNRNIPLEYITRIDILTLDTRSSIRSYFKINKVHICLSNPFRKVQERRTYNRTFDRRLPVATSIMVSKKSEEEVTRKRVKKKKRTSDERQGSDYLHRFSTILGPCSSNSFFEIHI